MCIQRFIFLFHCYIIKRLTKAVMLRTRWGTIGASSERHINLIGVDTTYYTIGLQQISALSHIFHCFRLKSLTFSNLLFQLYGHVDRRQIIVIVRMTIGWVLVELMYSLRSGRVHVREICVTVDLQRHYLLPLSYLQSSVTSCYRIKLLCCDKDMGLHTSSALTSLKIIHETLFTICLLSLGIVTQLVYFLTTLWHRKVSLQ